MMTVNEVSKRTGVSIRTLQYYDKIGLLRAAGRTKAGYRLSFKCPRISVICTEIITQRKLKKLYSYN